MKMNMIQYSKLFYENQEDDKMKHIKTLTNKTLQNTVKKGGCGECQTSCQSACKTSCTVGNQTQQIVKSNKDFVLEAFLVGRLIFSMKENNR